MKLILSILFCLLGPSVFAMGGYPKVGLSSKCASRVVNYRSSISRAANMSHYYDGISKAEGNAGFSVDELYAADQLSDAVWILSGGKRLSSDQKYLISEVCKLRHFDTDSVLVMLEDIARKYKK